jgi:hypothetical protein
MRDNATNPNIFDFVTRIQSDAATLLVIGDLDDSVGLFHGYRSGNRGFSGASNSKANQSHFKRPTSVRVQVSYKSWSQF